jgi:hypothetical protein
MLQQLALQGSSLQQYVHAVHLMTLAVRAIDQILNTMPHACDSAHVENMVAGYAHAANHPDSACPIHAVWFRSPHPVCCDSKGEAQEGTSAWG